MNEFDLQNAFWRWESGPYSIVCPNYTPNKWHECDIFAVTKAGYMVEIEIKVTKADFKADAAKCERETYEHRRALITGGVDARKTKHSRIESRDTSGPSRFYYLLPDGVVDDADVPAWAGIMRARVSNYDGRLSISTTRKAPKLHASKVGEDVLKHCQGVFYWRFWNERKRKRGGKIEEVKNEG